MMMLANLFKKIMIAVVAVFIALPGFAAETDIGDYGLWATPQNRELVNGTITNELNNFGPTASNVQGTFVPIEAKIGLAFMGGLSSIGKALDSSLVRFTLMFMLLAYAFWVAFEAYNLIENGSDAKEAVKTILIKGIWISVWLIVLKYGIAETFAMIMVPIVAAGTYISHVIWESVTSLAGFSIPDNCAAIEQYAKANTPAGLSISAESAAGLLCIPSQMSGFFVTIMGIGWKWVVGGVGVSLFSVIIGLYVTYLALKCIWKFLFVALGVIADLFLAMVLLPFTAIAETTAKTKYKGVAGDIFNSFLEIFKGESLEKQINRFIKAALYFVCLSVAIGVAISLLSFVIDASSGQISASANMDGIGGAIILILTLLLVCYMAEKAQNLAEEWGGKIDDGLGKQVQNDVTVLWKKTKKNWESIRKLKK